MRLPKVLGFTPTYKGKDYCIDDFVKNVKQFTYENYEHIIIDNTGDGGKYYRELKKRIEPLGIKVYHTHRGDNSREALAKSQNFARELFLKGDYDYLFSLEVDVFPKPNIIDALIGHGLQVVSGLYMLGFEKDNTRTPCITLDWKNERTGTWGTRLIPPEEFENYIGKGVKVVAASGMGVTLIYREVVEKIPYTYIPGLKGHSDVYWCNDARKLGYVIAVDTDIYCDHRNSSWEEVEDR